MRSGGELPNEPACLALATSSAHATAEAMLQVDRSWCDPTMVNVRASAADTYPVEPIAEHHFPTSDGIIVSAKPLSVV